LWDYPYDTADAKVTEVLGFLPASPSNRSIAVSGAKAHFFGLTLGRCFAAGALFKPFRCSARRTTTDGGANGELQILCECRRTADVLHVLADK